MNVSYLVSLYNKADYIQTTLAAIAVELADTGGEIVVYDDASTDNSVAQLLASPHSGLVRLIRGEVNGGCVLAASKLICEARHEFVRFVDADDLLVPGSTRGMIEALLNGGFDFVYGEISLPDTGIDKQSPVWRAQSIAEPLLSVLRNTAFNPSTMLIRTALLRRTAPLVVTLRHAQDFQMGVRMALQGARFGRIDVTVAFHPAEEAGRLSSRMAEMFGEMALFLIQEAQVADIPLPALRYAARRYTGRYLRYAAREAVIRPGPWQRLRLRLRGFVAPLANQDFALHTIGAVAQSFLLDREMVRKRRPP